MAQAMVETVHSPEKPTTAREEHAPRAPARPAPKASVTRKRGRLATVAALVGVAALIASGAWYFRARPIEVLVARVANPAVPVEIFGLGTVEARVLSKLGFEVSGTLIDLRVDHGDRVTKGVVLARLLSTEQEAKVAQARAAIEQSESAVQQAGASVQRAEANLRQKAQANERRQELVRRGTVSSEAAEDAQAAHDIAVAELAQAKGALSVAQANLAQARAQLATEEARLAKYTLTAPYDATVVSRQRELGSMVNPGEAVFTLIDPSTVWILAYIDETRAGHIRVGQGARITLRSLPERQFQGRVARVEIESDRVNEERRVYVACTDCPKEFHLGEQTEVVIATGSLESANLVPQAAVVGLQGKHGIVWTVENGRLQQRPVMFGQRTLDGRLEIVDGLPNGAQVVVRLDSGLRVRLETHAARARRRVRSMTDAA
jgi:HlyD family secretion protein